MTDAIQPQPDMIGGVPTPPFVILPRPAQLFARRAARFDVLAQDSALAPYLSFLSALTRVQAQLCETVTETPLPPAERIEQARAAAMPPLDRSTIASDPALGATLDALLAALRDIEMPAQARLAVDALRAADAEDRRWLLGNVMDDVIPGDAAAPHLFVAAAVQVHLSRLAAQLDGARLVPIRTGVCPCCGGRPASSVVTGIMGAEGARYAACAGCQTLWNEVRVKCLACGTNKGIAFQSFDTGDARPQVKAETCDGCESWVKQFAQNLNPALDPVADDVASLGLDATLREDGRWRRAGANPFLAGY